MLPVSGLILYNNVKKTIPSIYDLRKIKFYIVHYHALQSAHHLRAYDAHHADGKCCADRMDIFVMTDRRRVRLVAPAHGEKDGNPNHFFV